MHIHKINNCPCESSRHILVSASYRGNGFGFVIVSLILILDLGQSTVTLGFNRTECLLGFISVHFFFYFIPFCFFVERLKYILGTDNICTFPNFKPISKDNFNSAQIQQSINQINFQ